ncbi:MAG: FeoB-associated Cys-rich membrane protein [Sarcina sp.]
MEKNKKTTDIIAVVIALVAAISSYIFYETNIVLTLAIFLAVLLVYRRFIRNKKKMEDE